MSNPLENVGPYWSRSNAEFEQGNPSFMARMSRGASPMTGFGSALGQVHDGVSQGDVLGAALGAFQALPPVFAGLKTVLGPATGATKELVAQQVPSLLKTLKNFGVNATKGAVVDTINAAIPDNAMDTVSRLFTQQAPRTNTAAAIR